MLADLPHQSVNVTGTEVLDIIQFLYWGLIDTKAGINKLVAPLLSRAESPP